LISPPTELGRIGRHRSPFAQRNFLNTARAMFRWAAAEGRIPLDPTLGVARETVKTTGYRTWTEQQIAQFEAKHPIGSKGRLAFALLLYTGQRRGDVVELGRRDIRDGLLVIDQGKTEGGDEAHVETAGSTATSSCRFWAASMTSSARYTSPGVVGREQSLVAAALVYPDGGTGVQVGELTRAFMHRIYGHDPQPLRA